MSSDVIARVDAFADKAETLCDKGHLLRAAENFGRAAEAARALGADNLVTLYMRLRQGNMHDGYAINAPDDTVDPQVLTAHHAESVVLFSGAVDALERRRLAGTLLQGKCAAAEVAWCARDRQRQDPDCTAADAASWAALFGYEEFLYAARLALTVLSEARLYAPVCSDAQFQSFAQHVVHAAGLMQQPRRHSNVAMDIEATFADELRYAVANAGANGLDARLVQLLAGAWQRLQRSGVLRVRRVEENMGLLTNMQRKMQAAIQSSLNAPGLRSCALPGCGAKEAHPVHFKSCAACRAVVYCCREHQVAGWPGHKKACKAARKAAAAAEDDGAGPSGT